jgi:hypothetical protein
LLVASAVACGGRTGLLFSGDEPEGDDGGVGPGFDGGPGDGPSARDAGDGGGARDGPGDGVGAGPDAVPDGFIVPGAVSCGQAPGVQAGSPWPIARRCPARAANTSAMGPASPTVAWQAAAPFAWDSDPVLAADGTLYLHDGNAGVLAFAPDGTRKWSAAVSSVDQIPTSLAVGADGTVYAWNGSLTALDPGGSTLW